MTKVLITPRSFAKNDSAPLEMLERSGMEILRNDTGGIMNKQQMIEAIADCDGVIIGVDPLDKDVLSAAPKLKAVAKYGVGVDNIDLEYCSQHNIAVTRTVGANSAAVADYAFALMLSLARKVIPIDKGCREGNWSKITTSDVSGKTLGLIGLGAIGRQMVSRAKGFSMSIMAYDPFWDDAYAQSAGVLRSDISSLCKTCDFISLHLPLTEETRHMIGSEQLSMMKPDAFLINTARGGIIDDGALLQALKDKKIGGAGLDAFATEPPEDDAWYALDNVIIGSHCAASTQGAANAMSMMAAENLIKGLI